MAEATHSSSLPPVVLSVQDLTVQTARSGGKSIVQNIGFDVRAGETVCVVGESGSGKSVTSLALMRLVEHGGGKIVNGQVALRRRNGQVLDLARAGNATMRSVRGLSLIHI